VVALWVVGVLYAPNGFGTNWLPIYGENDIAYSDVTQLHYYFGVTFSVKSLNRGPNFVFFYEFRLAVSSKVQLGVAELLGVTLIC